MNKCKQKTAKFNPAGLILFWRLPVPLPGVHALLHHKRRSPKKEGKTERGEAQHINACRMTAGDEREAA